MYEGLAEDPDKAAGLIKRGEVLLELCHHFHIIISCQKSFSFEGP